MGEPPSIRVALVGSDADPLTIAIYHALPGVRGISATVAEAVASMQSGGEPLGLLVIHAPYPTDEQLRTLVAWRRSVGRATRVVLCTSLSARYRDLQLWQQVCDALVSEAAAPDTIGRHVDELAGSYPAAINASNADRRRKVAVVAYDFELRVMLADMCQRAGFHARPARCWEEARGGSLAVWHAPVQDARWSLRLRDEARRRRIVALVPFCERTLAQELRAHGARACMELPCGFDDLAWVLGRLSRVEGSSHSAHGPHPLPASHARAEGVSDAASGVGQRRATYLE